MSSTHLNIPRPLTAAVGEMTPLVDTFRELDGAMLVIRLGNEGKSVWSPGVGSSVFNEIYDAMSNYEGWDRAGEWEDFHEYTYTVGITPVVTSVRLSKELSLTHVVKHCVTTMEMKLLNHGRARVSVKINKAVDPAIIPDTVTPSRVKIKKQKTFRRHPWNFVFTKVWSGANRTEAELEQSRGKLVHNIEVGFNPDPSYWDSPTHSSTYVATSMLMKMVDVLGSEMFYVEPLVNSETM
jgi:hypothetical protein